VRPFSFSSLLLPLAVALTTHLAGCAHQLGDPQDLTCRGLRLKPPPAERLRLAAPPREFKYPSAAPADATWVQYTSHLGTATGVVPGGEVVYFFDPPGVWEWDTGPHWAWVDAIGIVWVFPEDCDPRIR
jgi:hypothetical protein